MKQLTITTQRPAFWKPTRSHLFFLRSFVLVAAFITAAVGHRLPNTHETCYRELPGCEACELCNNNRTNEECACLKRSDGHAGNDTYVCDEYCLSGQAPSVGNIKNWRVLGITMIVFCIGSIVVLFGYTLVKWYQTDTVDHLDDPAKVQGIEEKEEGSPVEASVKGDLQPAFPDWPAVTPPPPPSAPPEHALTESGAETGTSGSSYGSSTEEEAETEPDVPATPPPVPVGPKMSTAIS